MWVVRGVIHSCKRERSAFWLNLMHSGKKWWIREFVPLYIFPLNPDDVAARSLRSLRSNEVSLYFSSQLYFKIYEPLNMTLISHDVCPFKASGRKQFVKKILLGNLRTLTTTGSELQCTAQARPVNFVVVVSSTTPNKVESGRPAIHKLREG